MLNQPRGFDFPDARFIKCSHHGHVPLMTVVFLLHHIVAKSYGNRAWVGLDKI